MKKVNNALTKKVIMFAETMAQFNFKQYDNCYEYNDGTMVLDIRVKVNDDDELVAVIEQSIDDTYACGGKSATDAETEVSISALYDWFEKNGVLTIEEQAVREKIVNILTAVDCWELDELRVHSKLGDMWARDSSTVEIAVKDICEKGDMRLDEIDKLYLRKIMTELEIYRIKAIEEYGF